MTRWASLAAVGVVVLAGCAPSSADRTAPAADASPPAPCAPPDLARVSPSVREQIREAHARLRTTLDAAPAPAPRARAHADVGQLLLAARLFDAAEACLAAAVRLAPDDVASRYYLAHLSRMTGEHEASAARFAQVLERRPDDLPSLVWLGLAYLELDRPAEAEAPLRQALQQAPELAAARAALGRAALARRDYARAVEELEAALALAPGATSLQYPLGMAYRGLGELDAAAAHLERRGEIEVVMPDPLLGALEARLESAAAHEANGIRALELEEWAAAAEAFRRGLAIEPARPSLRHRLGTALYMMGDTATAVAELTEAVRLDPGFAQAHYSLGVIAAAAGRFDDATARFTAAVRADATHVEALVGLGDLLRYQGRTAEALAHYARAVELDPGGVDAWLGYGVALTAAARYAEARDRLTEALRLHAGHPGLTQALARVLAAAPDPAVRDGDRALSLLQPLMAGTPSVQAGEAMAMALAEAGYFLDAVDLQRQLIAVVQGDAPAEVVAGMTETLRRYEQSQPARRPWRPGETP